MTTDFTYRPWSEARRQAAKRAAAIRLYGSEKKAAQARAKKLKLLRQRLARLQQQVERVKALIHHYSRDEDR